MKRKTSLFFTCFAGVLLFFSCAYDKVSEEKSGRMLFEYRSYANFALEITERGNVDNQKINALKLNP